VLEVDYVSAPQTAVRDRVAAVYNKIGTVKNGDRVEVIDRERRFLKIRTAGGLEGWIEQRSVISQQVYDELQKLAEENKLVAPQATGVTRNETNIHLEPERESDHLYLLNPGDKVSILKRATTEKEKSTAPPPTAKGKKEPPKPVMEDWWLIRDSQGHTGWVLGRFIDLDVPMDVAQYAEGQRIQGFFVLNQVLDEDKKVAEYLVILSEPRDGLPYDYNQIRIFTWNVHRHRYETAYRERNLEGFFPVIVGHENFDKEGNLPIFILKVRNDAGEMIEKKYKMNTPMVRRVLAPGEVQEKSKPKSGSRQAKKHR